MNPSAVLMELQDSRCAYCDVPLLRDGGDGMPWQIDHMTPRARGGADEFANYALACVTCNVRKLDRDLTEFCLSRPPQPDYSLTATPWDRERAVLMGAQEIGKMLGVTAMTVKMWHDRHQDFPLPKVRLGCGNAWLSPDVEAWAIANGRLSAPLAEGGQPVRLKGGRPRIHPVQS